MTDERQPNEKDQSRNRTNDDQSVDSSNDEDRTAEDRISLEQGEDTDSESHSRFDAGSVVGFLQWGGLLALGILAVLAGMGLYSSLGSIIDVWVAREYRPFARTGLNLAVLAAAVAGIVAIIRRM